MIVQPTNNITFKCYNNTTEKLRDYGKVVQETGIFKGFKLDIYSAYSREGKLLHKLYYLADNMGNWIKSKLKYFDNNKCIKVVRSER